MDILAEKDRDKDPWLLKVANRVYVLKSLYVWSNRLNTETVPELLSGYMTAMQVDTRIQAVSVKAQLRTIRQRARVAQLQSFPTLMLN